MKILSVVGARPQFVKLAPVAKAFTDHGIEHVIVHTGQHYEHRMSEVFFRDLKIPAADVHLGVGSASHGAQTGAMLASLETVLVESRPDWVLVYGDTNSTLAGAIGAVKLHLRVAHLEAGLRSRNRAMPEEINRVLTDHAADLCLAPTALAMNNLADEGLGQRSRLVGDVMTDVCLMTRDLVAQGRKVPGVSMDQPYVLATLHRAENTDDPQRLARLVERLASLPIQVVLTVHPRLRDKADEAKIPLNQGCLLPIDPLSYPDMVATVTGARAVITDSGGLQKESFLLQTPCVTLRTETEWPETMEGDWNVLRPNADDLAELIDRPLGRPAVTPYGTGGASAQVVAALMG